MHFDLLGRHAQNQCFNNSDRELNVHPVQKHQRKQHTGEESAILIKYLIQDQAKAPVIPSEQMRWHSLVIKYCLTKCRS
jgi:hypothetical protein